MSELRIGAAVSICTGPGEPHECLTPGTLIAVEKEILSPPIQCGDGELSSVETPVIELENGTRVRGYECWWHYT